MKKTILLILLLPLMTASAQKSIVIMNGTAHIGNDSVIQNSMIGIRDGKITEVIDLDKNLVEPSNYELRIDAKGKQVYPGLISPNSTLGLTEIESVRATNDFREVGSTLPNVRSLIAYNTDSKIIPTVRTNGVFLAQITPRGGIVSGTSSVVILDGWNWEDAAYRIDDGIHINWPRLQSRKFTEDEATGNVVEKNKFYTQQTEDLKKLFAEAKGYSETENISEKNLRFEGMRGLFKG
ncbi:MAG: amidohydrolase, partial [Bacteroidota bacterium]|nr:amidohydrolase [Bacteroidota bacterium]